MALPRPSSPRAAFADLRSFLAGRGKQPLIAGALALALPGMIIWGFHHDAKKDMKPPTQLIYAESWSANRTDADIVAQQKIDSRQRALLRAERQRQYQRLERRLGI